MEPPATSAHAAAVRSLWEDGQANVSTMHWNNMEAWSRKSKQSSCGEVTHKTNWFHAKIGRHAGQTAAGWLKNNVEELNSIKTINSRITYFGTACHVIGLGKQNSICAEDLWKKWMNPKKENSTEFHFSTSWGRGYDSYHGMRPPLMMLRC